MSEQKLTPAAGEIVEVLLKDDFVQPMYSRGFRKKGGYDDLCVSETKSHYGNFVGIQRAPKWRFPKERDWRD